MFERSQLLVMMWQLNFTFESLHDWTDSFSHFTIEGHIILILILEFESCVKFFQGLKNLFSTSKDFHPETSSKFLVHSLIKFILFEDPSLNFMPDKIALNNLNGIGEVVIKLLLSKSDIVRIVGKSLHVIIVLSVVILK